MSDQQAHSAATGVQRAKRGQPPKGMKRGPKRRPQGLGEPLGISVNEALERAPFGRTKLYQLLDSGRLKSKRVDGMRVIDYQSFKQLVLG